MIRSTSLLFRTLIEQLITIFARYITMIDVQQIFLDNGFD